MKSGTKGALLAGEGEGEGVGEGGGERPDVGEEIGLGDIAVVGRASGWSPDAWSNNLI